MKLDTSNLTEKFRPLLNALKRYGTFMFIVTFLGIYTFLVMHVSTLVQQEPDSASISAEADSVKRLRIDQESIDKIQQLEAQNIEVRALFEEARNNPFTE